MDTEKENRTTPAHTKETTKETTKDMDNGRERTIGQMKEENHTARESGYKGKGEGKYYNGKGKDVETDTTK